MISLAFVPKGVPQTPRKPARFARRNVGFPKDSKHFGEKGVPETPKEPARFARRNVDFLRISRISVKMGCPKPQKNPARFARAIRRPSWPGQPSNRGLHTQKRVFLSSINPADPRGISFWGICDSKESLSSKGNIIFQRNCYFPSTWPVHRKKLSARISLC